MHKFDRSDTKRTNVWLHDMKYTWSPHCETVTLHPTLVYYSLHLVVHSSTHVGILINHSIFKIVVLHATIRLKTKLLINLMVNSQFGTTLLYMYKNKYQFQQTLIKKHLTDVSLLSPGIQQTVTLSRHTECLFTKTLDTHFKYLYYTTTDVS
jgi:hypothetical protein